MIEKNVVTESVRDRLLDEFDLIDTTFAVEKTDATQFSNLDLLTKLDRVVLKSTYFLTAIISMIFLLIM